MEPERTAEGSTAGPGAAETTDESPGACRRTMQETWSEIQSRVERSKVINVSIDWFLFKKPPGSCSE